MRKITLAIMAFFLLSLNNIAFSQDFLSGKIKVKIKTEKLRLIKNTNVKYNSEGIIKTGIQSLDILFNKYEATNFKPLFPTNSKFEKRHKEFGLDLWYIIEFKTNEKSAIHNIKIKLEKTNLFEFAEYYYTKQINVIKNNSIQSKATYNDPRFSEQWHYKNTGQTGGKVGADISLTEAWSIQTGSDDVIVAIIDGGIDYNHSDLSNSMWLNQIEASGNSGVDDDGNGFIDDIYGYNFGDQIGSIASHPHGTHVAGTVGASNNNGIGVSGIAGGTDISNGVRLMSCQTFGAFNADGFDVAFVYAADNGAVIAQNSWGYTSPRVYEQSVLDAIDYFIANAGYDSGGNPIGRMQGGLVVFAAGNDDSDSQWYPGYYAPVFTVAATNHNDQKSWYSNYGSWVDISAPGGETNSSSVQGVLSTLPGNSYGFYQGTSMACPHVSGVAALIASNSTNITPEEIKQTLLFGSDYIDNTNPNYAGKLGQGRLNAFKSLSFKVDTVLYSINDLSISYTTFNSVILNWTAKNNTSSGKYISTYDIRYSTNIIDNGNFESATKIGFLNNPKDSSEIEQFEINNLHAATEYYFAIKAIGILGNSSDISNVISVITKNPPQINISVTNLTDTLFTGESSKQSFEISNTGESDLDFTIKINYQSSTNKKGADLNVNSLTNDNREYKVENSLEDKFFKPGFSKKEYTSSSIYNILVLESASGIFHYDNALNNLGISRTLVTNWGLLEAELNNGTNWDLVIINSYLNVPATPVLNLINNHVLSGGSLIYSDWAISNYASHPLLQNMGIQYISSYSTPKNFNALDPSFQIFKTPNEINTFLWTDDQGYTDGQLVNILPDATQLAFFTSNPSNGAIVLNSTKNSFYNGFQAVNFNGNNDGDGKLDIVELIENQITYLLKGSDSWLNTDIINGTIASGSLKEVLITFNASGLNGGDYTADIIIENNDPDSSNYLVPASLNVIGAPEISIENDTILFKTVFVNQEIHDSIFIENLGSDTLIISSMTFNEPVFKYTMKDTILAPGEKEYVVLSFISTSDGEFKDSLEIISNSAVNNVFYLKVLGEALIPPVITVPTDSIIINLHTGDTLSKKLYIGNTGGSDLIFNIPTKSSSIDSTSVKYYSSTGETTTHQFYNISENLDSLFIVITLNGDYTSSNEYATLSIEGANLGRINNIGFPDGTDFTKSYAFDRSSAANWLLDNRLDVSIINSFEVNPGYGKQLNQVQLKIKGNDWFATSIKNGSVNIGDSVELKINFFAARLEEGEYSSELIINSNDPLNEESIVPLKLNVTAAADIHISEDSIVFDTTFITTSQNKSVVISNNGVIPLDISLTSNSGIYTLSDHNMIIPKGGSDTLTVTFTPSSENDFFAKITIITNDPDTPEDSILLFGSGLIPPVISTNPDSLFTTLDSGDSTILILNIANIGANILDYNVDNEYNLATKLSAAKIGFYANETRINNSKLDIWNVIKTENQFANNAISEITFHSYCTGLEIIGNQLLSIDYLNQILFIYNLNTFEVTDSFLIHNEPFGITYDGHYIWIGNDVGNFYAYSFDGTQHGSFSAPNTVYNSIEFNGVNFIVSPLMDSYNVNEIDYNGVIINTFIKESGKTITGISRISSLGNKYWGIEYSVNEVSAIKFELSDNAIHVLDTITLPVGNFYNTEILSNTFYSAPFQENKLYLISVSPEINDNWISYSPQSGSVNSGASNDLEIKIKTKGMYDGTYYANLIIESNDPANNTIKVPVTLNIIGYPELEINETELKFDSIFTGTNQEKSISLINTGTKVVHIDPVNFISSNFELKNSVPSSINPGESISLVINFKPSISGNFDEPLTFYSNAIINSTLILNLSGKAIDPPVIEIESDTIQVFAIEGTDCATTFSINNVGYGKLDFEISSNESGSEYKWESSLSSEKVIYDWIDISTIGETIYLTDDSYATKTLPFNFIFYNNIKNVIYISSNGFIGFNSIGITSYNNQYLPNSYTPNDIIAAYWTDLFPSGNDIFYYATDMQAIVQYNNMNGNTFQIILNSDNTIKFQYQTVNGIYNTTGIENSDGTLGLTIARNQNFLINGMAIKIYRDFDITNINPASGSINKNENRTIELNLESSELLAGIYYKNLIINCNDPINSTINLPIELKIVGMPIFINMPDTLFVDEGKTVDFIVNVLDHTNLSINISISNQIENISLSNNKITFSPNYSQAGNYKLIIQANNGYIQNTHYLDIKVVNTNRSPVISNSIGNKDYIANNFYNINLNDHFNDPDGDTLIYSASSSDLTTASAVILDNKTLTVSARAFGITQITVNASDGLKSVATNFNVTVQTGTYIENFENSSFTLYPNPSYGTIILNSKEYPNEKILMEIFDLTGIMLFKEHVISNNTINIKSLPEGLKIVKIYFNDKIYVSKLHLMN